MKEAIAAVQRGDMGWLRASKQFGVPQATLRRRAENKNKHVNDVAKGLGRFRTSLDHSMETDLANHLLDLESRLFGLTHQEVRKLVYQVAEANGAQHRFSREKKMAGEDWMIGFRRRHPEISVRRPGCCVE